jgi:hypothetical protein
MDGYARTAMACTYIRRARATSTSSTTEGPRRPGQGTEHFPSLLILVPNHRREKTVSVAFTDALARFKNPGGFEGLPFYVGNEQRAAERGVLGRVWALIPGVERRLSITELPSKEGMDYDLSDCIGCSFTEEKWAHLTPLSRRPRFPTGAPPGDEEPPNEGVVA